MSRETVGNSVWFCACMCDFFPIHSLCTQTTFHSSIFVGFRSLDPFLFFCSEKCFKSNCSKGAIMELEKRSAELKLNQDSTIFDFLNDILLLSLSLSLELINDDDYNDDEQTTTMTATNKPISIRNTERQPTKWTCIYIKNECFTFFVFLTNEFCRI